MQDGSLVAVAMTTNCQLPISFEPPPSWLSRVLTKLCLGKFSPTRCQEDTHLSPLSMGSPMVTPHRSYMSRFCCWMYRATASTFWTQEEEWQQDEGGTYQPHSQTTIILWFGYEVRIVLNQKLHYQLNNVFSTVILPTHDGLIPMLWLILCPD